MAAVTSALLLSALVGATQGLPPAFNGYVFKAFLVLQFDVPTTDGVKREEKESTQSRSIKSRVRGVGGGRRPALAARNFRVHARHLLRGVGTH